MDVKSGDLDEEEVTGDLNFFLTTTLLSKCVRKPLT